MDSGVLAQELGDFAGPSCLHPDTDPAALAAFGAALPRDNERTLFDYWLGKWRNAPPRRADILPEELGRLLPSLFLVEVCAPDERLRYRLIGAELAEVLGGAAAGRWLDEIRRGAPEPLRQRWQHRDRLSVAEARPLVVGWHLEHLGRAWRALATCRLPLLENGRVTHLLGCCTLL